MPTYSVFSVTSDKNTLPSDGSLAANLSAIIHDETGAVAPAAVTVNWAATSGTLESTTSDTDDAGTAANTVTATAGGMVAVTVTTADDTVGKTTSILSVTPLPAPTVSGASAQDLYILDYYDLQLGVQMVIPHYPNAAAGDAVTFWWGEYSHATVLSDPETELPMVINISSDIPPEYLQDGSYAVYYTAADAAGNTSYSSALSLTISNGGETTATLPKPDIPVAVDGYINIADAMNGVEVDVSYPTMAAGDVISLFWDAQDSAGNQILAASGSFPYTVADGETSHAFTLDSSLFFPNGGEGYQGHVTAYYTVTVPGESILELSFDATATVDTIPPGAGA